MATHTGPNTYRDGNSSMHGDSLMYDNSSMHDNSRMHGNSSLHGNSSMHDNSSMHGNSRMYGNSRMHGNSSMYGNSVLRDTALVNAAIMGDGLIESYRDYLVIGPAISSGRFTTAHRDTKIGVRINTGCFSGPLNEFIAAINKTHADNPPAFEQYMAFVALIRVQFAHILSNQSE